MALWADLAIFLAASIMLVISGSALVRTLTILSQFLRLSEFSVAFVLMGVTTTLPDLFVGITSAAAGTPALSLGNVIGSNLADLALIGGIAMVLARRFRITNPEVKLDSTWMMLLATLPLVLYVIGGQLSRIDGAILVFAFILYYQHLFRRRKAEHDFGHERLSRWKVVGSSTLFLISVAVLFLAARYVVSSGTAISDALGLPHILIGLLFIALGTSLPELVFSTRSVLQRHPEFAFGDLIGAVIVNSTLVLGVTSLITPITANLALFLTSAAFMLVLVFMFYTFVSYGRLNWRTGIALLLFYVLFLIIEFNVKSLIVNGTMG
jgi:cation:H+ antiporter